MNDAGGAQRPYRFIGKALPRKEDERLITGKGRFTDDFNLDGQAYAAVSIATMRACGCGERTTAA